MNLLDLFFEEFSVMNSLSGVVFGIAATFIYNRGSNFIKKRKDAKSFYSGRWESEIYDSNGIVEKRDVLDLIESHGKIKGEMNRIMPQEQNNRKWLVSGFVRNGHILLSIIAKSETQASDGSVYVVLKSDNIYEGFYLKKVEGKGIIQIPICLKLKKDTNRK